MYPLNLRKDHSVFKRFLIFTLLFTLAFTSAQALNLGETAPEFPQTPGAVRMTHPDGREVWKLPEDEGDYAGWTAHETVYLLTFADGEGAPLAGVMANVCDETTCQVIFSDEKGQAWLLKMPYAYEIHVIMAPGITADPEQVWLTPDVGGEMVIELGMEK